MIEPTETETKKELDRFIAAVRSVLDEAEKNPDLVKTRAAHDSGAARQRDARGAKARPPVAGPSDRPDRSARPSRLPGAARRRPRPLARVRAGDARPQHGHRPRAAPRGAGRPRSGCTRWSPPGVSLGWFQRHVDLAPFERAGYAGRPSHHRRRRRRPPPRGDVHGRSFRRRTRSSRTEHPRDLRRHPRARSARRCAPSASRPRTAPAPLATRATASPTSASSGLAVRHRRARTEDRRIRAAAPPRPGPPARLDHPRAEPAPARPAFALRARGPSDRRGRRRRGALARRSAARSAPWSPRRSRPRSRRPPTRHLRRRVGLMALSEAFRALGHVFVAACTRPRPSHA